MSASRMAKSQQESKGVSQALNPRPAVISTRNFLREHTMALRAKEIELRAAREAEDARRNEGPRVNPKYAHVESRVYRTSTNLESSRISTISLPINPASTKKKLHASFGRVPAYLNTHKAQLADKKRRETEARASELAIPSGHRVLPEDERLDTLTLLQKRKDDVDTQIAHLPLRKIGRASCRERV